MAVTCSNCGEELLGAVNRCWKCGSAFAAPPKTPDAPPIRRSPVTAASIAASNLATAVAAGEPISAEVLADGASGNENGAVPAAVISPNAPAPRRRRGSPFANPQGQGEPAAATVIRPAPAYRPPVDQARLSAATGGAIASIFLGVFGLCGAYFIPGPALVVAVAGVGMGLWGIYSERRGLAIAGLLLCCLTLALAGFFGAIELYTYIHGYAPWEIDPELRTGPTSDF